VAAIATLFGVNLLPVAVVFALATRLPGWMAALIVGGVLLVIGAVVGYIGWRRMVTTPLALTRQTLKEDVRWIKERVA
jgi:Putative Actinobacterial Holin-X, holin superfamily III